MGDRTFVTLIVLAEQADEARAILLVKDGPPEEDAVCTEGKLHSFTFSEVNYGDLNSQDDLQTAGIAYTSSWDSGDNYREGSQYCRFTEDGNITVFDVYSGDENPSINDLLERIDQPDRLRQFILDHREKYTPLPWDHQIEYGKRYRAKQLISS